MPNLKARLAAGQSVYGVMLAANSPALVEILGIVGYDFIAVDLQHSAISYETVAHLVRAASAVGIEVIARVADFTETSLLKPLDLGASGLILPFVQSVAEASQARLSTTFPPRGARSICSQVRASKYGLFTEDYSSMLKRMDHDTILVGVIENMQGLENLPGIARSGMLDVLALGRGDLAVAYGVPGQQKDARLLAAVDQGIRSIMESKTVNGQLGVFTYDETEIAPWSQRGSRFFCHMSETSLFARAARLYSEEFKRVHTSPSS